MKKSHSSTASSACSTHRFSPFMVAVLLLLLFGLASAISTISDKTLTSSSRNRYGNPRLHPCDHSLHHEKTRSLCIRFQRLHQNRRRPVSPPPTPPPPPPSPELHEIDPRYGVEKRLVPSGPNPLHN